MYNSKKGIIIFVIFIILFVGSVGLFSYGFLSGFRTFSSKTPNTYQFNEFNPNTQKSILGIAKTPRKLSVGESASSWKSNGNYALITNFGSKKFKCKGNCYCRSDRRNAQVLQKGIYFLLSAASLATAVQFSKKYFEDECVMKYAIDKLKTEDGEEFCEPEDVFADVDDCTFEDDEEEEADDIYVCEGHCIEFKDFIKKMDEHGEFRDKPEENRIQLLGHGMFLHGIGKKFYDELNCKSMKIGNIEIDAPSREIAKDMFNNQYLTDYCSKESTRKLMNQDMPLCAGDWYTTKCELM